MENLRMIQGLYSNLYQSIKLIYTYLGAVLRLGLTVV